MTVDLLPFQVIPEAHRANVMNWFRVPMNLITCGTLLLLRIDWISKDKRVVFGACLALSALGVIMSVKLIAIMKRQQVTSSSNGDSEEAKQSLLQNVG